MNPADVFTKHLPSSIKIVQLVKLFGCEYRQGRSAAAPLVRPLESTEGQSCQPSGGHLAGFEVECEEVEVHDPDILPHPCSEDEVERLFPRLEAPAPGPNVEDWKPSGEEQAREYLRAMTPVRRPPGRSRQLTSEKATEKGRPLLRR